MLHRFRKIRDASSKAVLVDKTRSKIEIIEKVEISINAFEETIWKMLFIEICYISNFLINVAASRKFRTKKFYFDDQDMRLCTADYRTLRLINDLNDHNVLKHQVMKHVNHVSNQILKRSISEKMKMKNEKSISEKMKMMKMKKFVQINSSKQTNNEVFDKIKHEKNKIYQRAENTQLYSRIKFKSFDFISTNWLKHRNVKSTRFFHIAVDGFVFIKALSSQRNKRTHRFDWSKN